MHAIAYIGLVYSVNERSKQKLIICFDIYTVNQIQKKLYLHCK